MLSSIASTIKPPARSDIVLILENQALLSALALSSAATVLFAADREELEYARIYWKAQDYPEPSWYVARYGFTSVALNVVAIALIIFVLISLTMVKESDVDEAQTQSSAEQILRGKLSQSAVNTWLRYFGAILATILVMILCGLALMFACVAYMFDVRYPLIAKKSTYGYFASNLSFVTFSLMGVALVACMLLHYYAGTHAVSVNSFYGVTEALMQIENLDALEETDASKGPKNDPTDFKDSQLKQKVSLKLSGDKSNDVSDDQVSRTMSFLHTLQHKMIKEANIKKGSDFLVTLAGEGYKSLGATQ